MKGTIELNGETLTVDTQATLTITNTDADRVTVAAEIGHWGAIWAECLQRYGEAEAEAEGFRARGLKGLIESEEKVAEWKAKAVVDSSEEYQSRRNAVAYWNRCATLARCQFEAFKAKAEVLKGLSYREHGEEAVAAGVGREVADPPPERAAKVPASEDPRVKKLAEKHGSRNGK